MAAAEPPNNACGLSQPNDVMAALVERARAGEVDAFSQLYTCTSRWLLARIRRLVGSSLAEDVLAEVYIQAWDELERFDAQRGAVGTWLAVIARSRALDCLRREKRLAITHRDSVRLDLAFEDTQGSPEEIVSSLEYSRLLRIHMARSLSSQERLVLCMAYFRDNSHREIAELTGMPLRTVKSLIEGAQEKLRGHVRPPASSFSVSALRDARPGP
jgi:RNA polymerase sigma-70 factor, ECF subfamily